MSEELDDVSYSLVHGELPLSWKRLAPDTRKNLAEWIIHLKERSVQYIKWIQQEIQAIWLSGLHSPKSYLIALTQSSSRYNGWSLDKTTFSTIVTDFTSDDTLEEHLRIEKSNENWGKKSSFSGGYVSGLYLMGAGWDNEKGKLKRLGPRELLTALPIIKIVPIEVRRLKLQNTIKTPVYVSAKKFRVLKIDIKKPIPFQVTTQRTTKSGEGLVFEADIPTNEHPSHSILNGICLTLNKE